MKPNPTKNRFFSIRTVLLSIVLGIAIIISISFPKIYSNDVNQIFVWDERQIQSYELIEDIPDFSSYINWTTGKVRTQISIPFKYGNPNIGELINNYAAEMKALLRQNMIKALAYLRISDIFSLKDYYSQKSAIRFEIIDRVDSATFYPPLQKGNYFSGIVELNLYGKKGLATLFYRDIENLSIPTKYLQAETTTKEYYDSLIIDTIIYKDFKPSIQFRIYDTDGNLIYGPEIVDKQILNNEGICEYTTSLTHAFNSKRTGNKIFYLIPYAIKGKMKTDVVIHKEDAAQLLANPKTLEYLKKVKVVVVKPERE